MKELIASFPDHLRDALEIAHRSRLKFPTSNGHIRNIVISGLGGSGIGGKIAAQALAASCEVPIVIANDYVLPEFAGSETLVIISSYSGDTEETLATLQEALHRTCEISCITSGGKVAELARARSLNLIVIPGGNPPRSMLGYSLIQLFRVLHGYGFCNSSYSEQVERAIDLIHRESAAIQSEAGSLAQRITDRIPILYSESSYEGLAIRWRQQINENAKMLCWHHVFPEMNHNELVGWTGGSNQVAVLMIRTDDDHPRTRIRMDISKKIFSRNCDTVLEVHAKGGSRIERSLYLIHLGDWLSLRLSELRGVDAVAIPDIDFLKKTLASF